MFRTIKVGFLLIFFLCIGCTSGEEPNMERDKRAIRALFTQATEANNQEDADSWATLFTDDAVLMPQGGRAIQGKDALLASEKGLNDEFDASFTITPIEIVVTGDWAFARTEVKGLKTPAEGGEPSIVDAKEVLILRRQSDQSWKVHRLIGNTNMPSVPWHAGKGATNDEADIAAIRALLEHNESVISSEDLDGWIGQFTDDAIFMLPDKKVLIGREAGRESIRQWFEQFDMEAAISIDEIEVFGDQALVRWSVKFQSTPTSGDEPTSRDVKEIWILQRQHDGSWKCSHIIYNYDSPPPAPTLMEK